MSSLLIGGTGTSPTRILAEEARREIAQDENFVKNMLYFFELRVPDSLGGSLMHMIGVPFYFPLVINPQSYSLSEPFTVEATPTQGGGLYVEENGIVQRILRLKGHTGFKPRRIPKDAWGLDAVNLKVEKRSYSRRLLGAEAALVALSGHKHFQYLQDAVFRTYADLKRDPETSEDTRLIFHNLRDEESWLVVPQKFDLNRSAEKRVLYEYDIELLVVDSADSVDVDFSEDKGMLEKVRDGIRAVKSYVDTATGFIRDVQNTIGELERLVKDASKIIGSITDLTSAATSLVEGTVDLIESPLALVDQLTGAVDGVSNLLSTTVDEFTNIPASYTNSWRRLSASFDKLTSHSELFETNSQRTLRKVRTDQEIRTASARAQANLEAGGAEAPSSIEAFGEGTEPLSGVINRADAELGAGRSVNRYTAAKEVTVAQGDTLSSLAATYLGDARLWQDVALINGMKPPFIDTQADAQLGGPDNPIPGVTGLGGKIVVPTFGRAQESEALTSVIGARPTESHADRVLGTDFKLTPTNERKDQYDWEVDVEHGAIDFKHISGFDNLAQALTTRLTTERGHNILYKRLGLKRVVGLNQVAIETQLARFRVIEAVQNDPRIASLSQIKFGPSSPIDAIDVDLELRVKGFSQGESVRAIGVTT